MWNECSALSGMDRGRICFDGAEFKVSEAGGPYTDLITIDEDCFLNQILKWIGTWACSPDSLGLPFITSISSASMLETAFLISQTGIGSVGHFAIDNSSNSNPALKAITNGTGAALRAVNSNLARMVNIIEACGTSSCSDVEFKVNRYGNVLADGAYYTGCSSGSCINTGAPADIAERIDTTEKVEPGDVVEIDPDKPNQYRLAREPYSTRVAGVISTQPAITMGNNFRPDEDKWEDIRLLLALVGVVPVKVTTEDGGPIRPGDLLTAGRIGFNKLGYAMKCPEVSRCIGAIIGKALEPPDRGEGKIKVLIMLK